MVAAIVEQWSRTGKSQIRNQRIALVPLDYTLIVIIPDSINKKKRIFLRLFSRLEYTPLYSFFRISNHDSSSKCDPLNALNYPTSFSYPLSLSLSFFLSLSLYSPLSLSFSISLSFLLSFSQIISILMQVLHQTSYYY